MGKSAKKESKGKVARVAAGGRTAPAEAKEVHEARGGGQGPVLANLAALKAKAKDAQEGLEGARAEAGKLQEQGKVLVDAAKEVYLKVLEPYRDACQQAGVPCEFEGSRAPNRTAMVRFLVEKAEKGIKVTVKGKPDTEETIPFKALKESVGREAYAYTGRHLGPKEEIGNKGGGLANRLKAVLHA